MTFIAFVAALISAVFGAVAGMRGLDARRVTMPAFAIFAIMVVMNVTWLSVRDVVLRNVALTLIALALVTTSFAVGLFAYTLLDAFKGLFHARSHVRAALGKHGGSDDLPL